MSKGSIRIILLPAPWKEVWTPPCSPGPWSPPPWRSTHSGGDGDGDGDFDGDGDGDEDFDGDGDGDVSWQSTYSGSASSTALFFLSVSSPRSKCASLVLIANNLFLRWWPWGRVSQSTLTQLHLLLLSGTRWFPVKCFLCACSCWHWDVDERRVNGDVKVWAITSNNRLRTVWILLGEVLTCKAASSRCRVLFVFVFVFAHKSIPLARSPLTGVNQDEKWLSALHQN